MVVLWPITVDPDVALLEVVPLAVVLLFEPPPHAAARSAEAAIAASAARRREIKDISRGSFSIGISFTGYAIRPPANSGERSQ
jgi:hypothetical protein